MRRLIKFIFVLIWSLFLLGCFTLFCAYHYFSSGLPDVSELKSIKLQQPMEVFTADGKLIATFGEHRRIPLKYDEIPPTLINAVIATEDSRFFEHYGIDPVGIIRAVHVALTSGTLSQGASTITQQVAKNFFLSPEKTVSRKLKEIILAFRIEKVLSKQEILILYLNKIYLGSRAYGVGAAAYTFFGKNIDELTLGEMATIAGLAKAPSQYNPIYSNDKAITRRNWVLYRMLEQEFITQQQHDQAIAEPLIASYHDPVIDFSAPYIAEMARQYMIDKFGEDAYRDGYKVYTTVTKELQQAADGMVEKNIFDYDTRHGYRGPYKILWQTKKQEAPWSREQILRELKNYANYGSLYPAVVVNIVRNTGVALMANGEEITIPYEGVSWARAYRTDAWQGGKPTSVAGVMQPGQLIWVRKTEKYWKLAQIPGVNSALVSLDANTGAIKALVGGFNFNLSKFNRATQAIRQSGSNIKPFVYAAALDKGLTLATIINDAPIAIRSGNKIWMPKNAPNVYQGPMRLRVGLGLSKNVVMVRVMREIGVDYAADYMHRFGLPESNIVRTHSLALGAASFTPLQIARGYAVFNNGGFLITPYLVERIDDAEGNPRFVVKPKVACPECTNVTNFEDISREHIENMAKEDEEIIPVANNKTDDLRRAGNSNSSEESELDENDFGDIEEPDENKLTSDLPAVNTVQSSGSEVSYAPAVISQDVAFLMRDALISNVWGEAGGSWRPTGWRARALNRRDVGGKTGTTNKSKDAWFSGFGGNIVTTVWMGFDDHRRSLGREDGSRASLPAWIGFMKVALKDVPIKKVEPPKGIVRRSVDGRSEYFIVGTTVKSIDVSPFYYQKEAGTTVIDRNGNRSELF